MSAQAEQQAGGFSTPAHASKPKIDVSATGAADGTIFSPGIHTPGHDISSLFRSVQNTEANHQKAAPQDKTAAADSHMDGSGKLEENSPLVVGKKKGCLFGLLKK